MAKGGKNRNKNYNESCYKSQRAHCTRYTAHTYTNRKNNCIENIQKPPSNFVNRILPMSASFACWNQNKRCIPKRKLWLTAHINIAKYFIPPFFFVAFALYVCACVWACYILHIFLLFITICVIHAIECSLFSPPFSGNCSRWYLVSYCLWHSFKLFK